MRNYVRRILIMTKEELNNYEKYKMHFKQDAK